MKTLLARYQGKKFFTTIAAWAAGAYLIKSGHVMEGTALITGAQATFNIGQGNSDAASAKASDDVVAIAMEVIANAKK